MLVAGVVALWLRRTWLGASLVTLAALPLTLLAFLPLGAWLMVPLENRFPPPEELPEGVDGVIVLGGAPMVEVTAARDQPTLSNEAERLTALVELGRVYPGARLVFTGGSGRLGGGAPATEAAVVREFYRRQGFDLGRLVFEDRARNTVENARLMRALLDPKPGERWLLVTSAYHMPRSVGVFRRAGWPPVIAYPVDYRTTGRLTLDADPGSGVGSRLNDLDFALREWIGLVAYRLLGRTDALLPAPDPPPPSRAGL